MQALLTSNELFYFSKDSIVWLAKRPFNSLMCFYNVLQNNNYLSQSLHCHIHTLTNTHTHIHTHTCTHTTCAHTYICTHTHTHMHTHTHTHTHIRTHACIHTATGLQSGVSLVRQAVTMHQGSAVLPSLACISSPTLGVACC